MDYITPKDLSKTYNKSEKRIRKILRINGYQSTWKNGYYWQIPKEINAGLFDKLFKK